MKQLIIAAAVLITLAIAQDCPLPTNANIESALNTLLLNADGGQTYSPNVTGSVQYVCQAQGSVINTYKYVALIATFTSNPGQPEQTRIFTMQCSSGSWSGLTNDGLENPPASVVGVPPRTNCYRCRAGFGGDTRCRECNSACNSGLMRCNGSGSGDCCLSFTVNGQCDGSTDCSSSGPNYVATENNNFTCTCNLTCSAGYTAKSDCTDCDFTSICDRDSPCMNGGQCIQYSPASNYTCDCTGSYTGYNCSDCNLTCPDGYTVNSNCIDCDFTSICDRDSPCMNGGQCIQYSPPDNYTCNCTGTGYQGVNCTGSSSVDLYGSTSSSVDLYGSTSSSVHLSLSVSSSVDSSVTNLPSTATSQLLSLMLMIVAPVVFVLLLCVCIVIVFVIVIIVRRNRRKEHLKLMAVNLNNVDLSLVDHSSISLDLNSAYQGHHQKDETPADDSVIEQLLIKYLVPSSQIDIQETIGQGEFGIVYKATVKARNESPQEIALKTLKGEFSKSDVNSLLEECLLMSNFDNPNVLSLIGVCADLGPAPCIIMPYMSRGSLLSYLQKEKSHLIVKASSEESTVLNVRKQLLSVCLQVANGMSYLASQRFIHRDLAARNCLIADNGVIKVADFGLSEEIYTKNYFNQFKESKSAKLPVKWLALESLHYGIFSEKSDVWSYGVLCWEVFSAGKIPYPGMDPTGLVELLDTGQRLSCPHNEACSEDIYSLMLQCWCESSDDRPLFSDLVASVNTLIMPLAPYLIVSNDSSFQLNHDHIYY